MGAARAEPRRRSWPLGRLAAVGSAGLLWAAPLAGNAQTDPAPWHVVIEHSVVMGASAAMPTRQGRALELSALAWDARAGVLVAASDRGRLHGYRPGNAGGALPPTLLWTRRLDDGAAGARPNIEALAWRAATANSDGELLLAEEFGAGVQRRSPEGGWLGTLPWPRAVADALATPGAGKARHGVEAIGHHAQHGLLAGLQRPLPLPGGSGAPPRLAHWVHAADGTRWGFVTAGPRSQLKALEVLADGSMLLLERVQPPRDPQMRAVLRRLDPLRCDSQRLCDAPSLEQRPAPLVGADNFEGLACAPAGPCWLVSDDGGGGGLPTRWVQFRLVRP